MTSPEHAARLTTADTAVGADAPVRTRPSAGDRAQWLLLMVFTAAVLVVLGLMDQRIRHIESGGAPCACHTAIQEIRP